MSVFTTSTKKDEPKPGWWLWLDLLANIVISVGLIFAFFADLSIMRFDILATTWGIGLAFDGVLIHLWKSVFFRDDHPRDKWGASFWLLGVTFALLVSQLNLLVGAICGAGLFVVGIVFFIKSH